MDKVSEEQRSWNMSRIRSKDTAPERMVRSLLHKAGYCFRLHQKKLPGSPGIVLARYKTAIFVNGCFWHQHKNCRYAYIPKTKTEWWKEKFKRTVERDQKNIEKLILSEYRVLIIWECTVNLYRNNAADLSGKIIKFLEGKDKYHEL